MRAQYLEFKLYLEGVEVEFVDVQLLEDSRRPPSCTIIMAANDVGMDILPCTTSHLFHKVNNEWLLIFEGELTSKSFQKSSNQRTVSLHFLGLTNNLNRVYKKAVATLTMDAFHNTNFMLIDSGNTDSIIQFPSETISSAGGAAFTAVMFKRGYEEIAKFWDKEEDAEDGTAGAYKPDPKAGYESAIDLCMNSIFKDAAETSPWYRQIYNSMQVGQRILAFQNKMIYKSLHKIANASLVRNVINPLRNLTPLTELIYNFLSYFGYKMLHLSAPAGDKTSIVFMANSNYFAPIKANMFFSDNVENASFLYDAMKDPTRVSVASDALSFMEDTSISFTPVYFAPSPLPEHDEKTGKIDLTREEQYRGIFPSIDRLTGIDSVYGNILEGGKTESNEEKTSPEREENIKTKLTEKAISYINNGASGDVTSQTARTVSKMYWDKRYNSRTFNMVAAYSPYRITGIAGVFIDHELPSIIGMVSTIQTTISAGGRAVSTIIFDKPRIVWDWNAEGAGINTADITPLLEPWFDEEVYSLDKIGPKVYNKLIGEDDTTKDKSSIMAYGKLDTTFVGEVPELVNLQKEINNPLYATYLLSKQVKSIKDYYFSLNENDRHRFEQVGIKRKLMEEEEFWRFLLPHHADSTINSKLPYTPSNIIESEIYRDIDNEKDQISIFSTDEDFERIGKKPFIKQRKDAIERL